VSLSSSPPIAGANRGFVAVTGATGFIGGIVTRRLATSGWQVRALVRDAAKAEPLRRLGIELVQGDLADDPALRTLVSGAHGIVHCAGVVRGVNAGHFFPVNVNGVGNLARAAASQQPPPRFLLLSSLAAREPQLSPYAASKRAGEEVLASIAGPMPWIALRPPAVYGPGDREMLPLLRSLMRGLAPVLGAEHARFSLLYVADLAAAIECCLESPGYPTGIFELHDGRPGGYLWRDVIAIAAALRGGRVRALCLPHSMLRGLSLLSVAWGTLSGQPPMLTPGKVRELTHPDWVCDNLALSGACGWEPAIDFAEGLKRTLRETGAAA